MRKISQEVTDLENVEEQQSTIISTLVRYVAVFYYCWSFLNGMKEGNFYYTVNKNSVGVNFFNWPREF